MFVALIDLISYLGSERGGGEVRVKELGFRPE